MSKLVSPVTVVSVEVFGGFGGDNMVMGLARDIFPRDSSRFFSSASAEGALPERVEGPVLVKQYLLTT